MQSLNLQFFFAMTYRFQKFLYNKIIGFQKKKQIFADGARFFIRANYVSSNYCIISSFSKDFVKFFVQKKHTH